MGLGRWLSATGLIFGMSVISGCFQSVQEFARPGYTTTDSDAPLVEGEDGKGWYAVQSADFGAIHSQLAEQSLTIASAAATAGSGTPSFTLGISSYRHFQVTGNGSKAVVLGVFPKEATSYRVLARTYDPHGLGGGGWKAMGGESGLLDAGDLQHEAVTGGFSPTGDLLAAFWPRGATGFRSAVLRSDSAWGYAASGATSSEFLVPSQYRRAALATAADLQASGASGHFFNGATQSIAWDSVGNGYLALTNYETSGAHRLQVHRYLAFTGWESTPIIDACLGFEILGVCLPTSTAAYSTQVELLNDGYGATLIYRDPVLGKLYTKWIGVEADSDPLVEVPMRARPGSGTYVNADGPRAFGAAADSSGNVVVAFIDDSGTENCSASTTPATVHCGKRLYASYRTAAGVWYGPSRIDPELSDSTSTYFQIASTSGLLYPTPAVAALGSGRFLVAYSAIDLSNRKSVVRVRGLSVGSGWDAESTLLEEACLNGADPSDTEACASTTVDTDCGAGTVDAYRLANDLRFESDGQGRALLILNSVLPGSCNIIASGRKFGFKAYRYSSAGWSTGQVLNDLVSSGGTAIAGCAVSTASDLWPRCWDPKMSGAIFTDGSALVVFPAPATEAAPTQLRLYSVEYR